MALLLERVGTLLSANLNYLVSKALKANSMAVLDEYVRRVEDNLEALEDAAATVGGEAKGQRRKFTEYQAKADEMDQNIDLFLAQGKTDLARAAQSRYNTVQRLAQTYQEHADAQDREFEQLKEARLKLEMRLAEVKQEKGELQAMLDLAKSKELTHKVVEGVAGTTTAESGIAEIREEIRRRLDKASAQGEIDASRLESQMSEALEEHALDAQLAERKRRLGMDS